MEPPFPVCGPAPRPEMLLWAWNPDPVAIAVALAPALIGRGRAPALAASAVLLVAFVSPLCALTVALFSARALHHLVLIGLAGPALALAWPRVTMGPMLALAGLSAVLWAWHLPPVYAAAWGSAAVYWALQAAMLGAAWAFWAAVFRQPVTGGPALLALVGQMGLLGAILTLSPRVLYPEHLALTGAFGLSPLADQQLAGLVMWVPGMLPLALAGALMLRRSWRAVAP